MNWKGELAQMLTFAVAPALGAAAAWWSVRSRAVDAWSPRVYLRVLIASWLLTRIATYGIVFHVFRYAGGHDLLDVWAPIARTILDGGDPSALVDNLYGPVFPYTLAAGLWLGGGHAPATGLVFLAGDALSLLLLDRIAARRLGPAAARRIVLLTLLSPLVWHGLVVRIQDEPLFLAFLLLVQDRLDRRDASGAALATAAGTLLTKALFPLFALPVLLAFDGSWRERAGRVGRAAAATSLALAVAVACGWQPVGSAHGTLGVRGSSSWWLFGSGSVPRSVFVVGLVVTAAACVATAVIAARRPDAREDDRAARGVSATQSAFFVLSPFTLPSHLAHGVAHLAWQVVRAGASRARAPLVAQLILVPFLAFQVVLTWLNPERWSDHPWLIALFVAWCAFVGWDALRGRWDQPTSDR